MNSLTKQILVYKIPIIAIVVGLLTLGVVIIPQALAVPKTNEEISGLKIKNEALTKKIGQLDQVNESEYQSDVETVTNALPIDREIPGAFVQLMYLMQSNGLTLQDIGFNSPPGVPSNSRLEEYVIKLGITGNSDDLVSFIEKLKEMPRIMKVTGIELNSGQTAADIQATVNLTTFFLGLSTNLGAVEQPINLPTPADREVIEKIKTFMNNLPSTPDDATGTVGKANPFQ